jgi:hypothetical protein
VGHGGCTKGTDKPSSGFQVKVGFPGIFDTFIEDIPMVQEEGEVIARCLGILQVGEDQERRNCTGHLWFMEVIGLIRRLQTQDLLISVRLGGGW